MPKHKNSKELPNLSPGQVLDLTDSLLANANALLVGAFHVLDQGHPALARSLGILAIEESGKAIALHERRKEITQSPEGTPFVGATLQQLWRSHPKKLAIVHSFLLLEEYWFGAGPPDPELNVAQLGPLQVWKDELIGLKEAGFYVDVMDDGAHVSPDQIANEEDLQGLFERVDQIGEQLRLGQHIEFRREEDRARVEATREDRDPWPVSNYPYSFTAQKRAQTSPFEKVGARGYEAQDRALKRLLEERKVLDVTRSDSKAADSGRSLPIVDDGSAPSAK